jgi:5-methylcytosine-specific restriction endonuclease McrA
VPEKLCIGCKARHIPVGRQQRCPDCARGYERAKRQRRGTRQQRGYDKHWYVLARQALALTPFCAACGTTDDLTVDHRDPTSRAKPGLTLEDVQVLCRGCNARKGDSRLVVTLEQAPPPSDDAPLIA